MRAKEFVNESELQQLQERSFWDKVASGAAHFGKGAGLVGSEDFNKIMDKMRPGKIADNAAGVLQGQITRINQQAKKQDISKDNPKYEHAIEGAVKSLFSDGLNIDLSNPTYKKAMDGIIRTAIENPDNLRKEVEDIIEPLIKTMSRDKGPRGGEKTTLKKATIGPDEEGNDASIVTKEGNKWIKFEREQPGGPFERVELSPEDIRELDRKEAAGELDLRDLDIIKYNDNQINLASEKASDAADAMAKNAQDDVSTSERWATKFKEIVTDYILQNPKEFPNDEEGIDKAATFVDRQLEANKAEEALDSQEQIDDLKDSIMQDPNMPWNYKPETEFRALVYSPGGTRYVKDAISGENNAYVRNQGQWSRWKIGPSSTWKFQELLTDPKIIKQLEVAADEKSTDIVPLTFRQDDVEGKEDYYRVTSK